MDKKADLLQSVSVQDQYEKLLQDYAEFLETANEKLKTETINVKDLHQLKQQLAAHKVSKQQVDNDYLYEGITVL